MSLGPEHTIKDNPVFQCTQDRENISKQGPALAGVEEVMSRSNKARNGTQCKRWKDTVLGSRSQKRAWTKRKRIRAQQERARQKAELQRVCGES